MAQGVKHFTEHETLERARRQNWFLLLAVLLLTTIGFVASVWSLLALRDFVPWPWPGSEPLLLVGLVLVQVALGVHLTRQQLLVARLQADLLATEQEARRQLERHEAHLLALNKAAQTLADLTTSKEVFERICGICLETFDCRQVSLMLLEADHAHLAVVAATGHMNVAAVRGARLAVGEGVAGWVAQHRTPLILGENVDPGQFPGFREKSLSPSAAMVVPILVRNELVGVLNVSHRDPGKTYRDEDLRALLVFSWTAAAAIRHTEHRSWMRQTIDRFESGVPGERPKPEAA